MASKRKEKMDSTQALLREQLSTLTAPTVIKTRPINRWSKSQKRGKSPKTVVSADGVPLTKAEILRREEERTKKTTTRRNAEYLRAGGKAREQERSAVARVIAEQRRRQTRVQPKPQVKIGERKLGPGFLERYGSDTTTDARKA